jgi:hypothetical protein
LQQQQQLAEAAAVSPINGGGRQVFPGNGIA